MAYVVVVVILLWVAALTIPMSNGFLYGGASGASAVMLVYVALIIAKRRGYETFVVRELEKRGDERDRAVKQKMWVVAGRTALPIMLILFVVSFTSLPISLFVKVAAFAYSVVVGTARFYYDRTM